MIERILELMEERRLNGIQLAAECGFAKNAISEWKTGKRKPGASAITKLAEYFGVSADYLLGLTDDRAPIGGGGKKKHARWTSRRRCGIAA